MATNQSKPERSGFYYNLGAAYYALGQLESALESYDEAVRINPEYHEAYHNRGNVYHDLSQSTRAIEDYDQAIQRNPEYSS